ncbi:MAG: toll/interleukin-1 receptor domain-containing protein, partial [Parvularculaceae bacterium]
MPDIFISYSREDRPAAALVASSLQAEGFTVWWDAVLRAGESYDEVTEDNLRNAGAVVVLWSKRSSRSKWVR